MPNQERKTVFRQKIRRKATQAQRRRRFLEESKKNKDDPICVTGSKSIAINAITGVQGPSPTNVVFNQEIPCDQEEFSNNTHSSTPITPWDTFNSPSDEPSVVSLDEMAHSPSLPDLIVEHLDPVQPKSFPSGRVICDMGYVITQARKLEEHNYKCNYNGKLIYSKVYTRGLVHTYTFVCDNKLCRYQETLVTDRKTGCLNQLAVFGAMSAGNGFSQEEQKFSIMNMTYMSGGTYRSSEKAAGDIIEAHAKDTMAAAIDEEKRLAEERCDVDNDGFYNVCAIVDGGWCKRTYGHGYNASSGVAVIIGAVTQKIIFISVRSLVCKSIKAGRIRPRDHTCYKNWTSSSTAMESDIIVEGLKYLEEVHNIRCTRLIGDGDTNLMKKVQENVSFGGRVMKVECANHAVRRYFRALERIQTNTSKFNGVAGVKARKILLQRMSRLILGARAAIKNNAVPNLHEPDQDKVRKLADEILNGPAHVFGKHDSCTDFCNRKESDPDPKVYEIMTNSGMYSAIKEQIQRALVSCCDTLIFNVTNNPAENYMSQFCKTIGGKRIDFGKGGSIRRRANIAAVAYQNPAQKWQHNANKALTGQSPGTPHKKYLARKMKYHINRLNRKKLFVPRRKKEHVARGGDENYGDQPDVPDLNATSLQQKILEHMSSITVKTRDEFEEATRGQSLCEKWREERCKRIPSSLFKAVAGRRPTTLCANLVKSMIYRENISTNAMEYGKANEHVALRQYEVEKDVKVQRCGMFVDPKFPFLCTSPDGLIGKYGLVEVKCPYLAKSSSSLLELVEGQKDIGLKYKEGTLYLPNTHKYYYQIQGQLAITDRKWCDLFVWSPKDTTICHIQRDDEFWNKIVPKLQQFYTECCLPEIVDPRVPRKQPIREPLYILEAIKQKNDKKITTKRKKAKPSKLPKESVDQTAGTSGRGSACQEVTDGENQIEELSHPTEKQANVPFASCFSSRPKRAKKPKVIFDM